MATLKELLQDWSALSARVDEALGIDADSRETWLASLPEPDAIKAALRELLDAAPGLAGTSPVDELPQLVFGFCRDKRGLVAPADEVSPFEDDRSAPPGGSADALPARSDARVRTLVHGLPAEPAAFGR